MNSRKLTAFLLAALLVFTAVLTGCSGGPTVDVGGGDGGETEAEETTQFFTHILTKGIKEGYFREDADIEFQIYLFGKQLQFLREPETTTQMEYPFARVISAILDNFMLALATEKGRKEFEQLQQTYRNT